MSKHHEISRKRPTIYDLAALAGTSPTAVSAVLSGSWKKRRISERLASRIMDLAKEQGYALNFQARALRRERSNIIGMIVPKYDNRYFGAMAERFNGRISDVLQSHHFVGGEDLAQTLYRYVLLYNQQLPQSTLGSKTPLDAMQRWYESHPHLFVKRPCNLAGGDTARRAYD